MSSALQNLQESVHELAPQTRKNLLVGVACLLLLALLYSVLLQQLSGLTARRASREQTLKEVMLLRQRYQEASAAAQRLTNKMASATAADTPATIVEQTGLVPKGGLQSKPLPRQEQGQLIEEGAELTISGLGLNETVNLLHRLEQGSKPLVLKKALIRTRFNDPSKLDLTLQATLLRPAPSQAVTR